MKQIMIKFGELFLKSDPVKKRFINKLVDNIKIAAKSENIKININKQRDRLFCQTDQFEKMKEILQNQFGISYFTIVEKTDDPKKIIKKFEKEIGKNQSFAIRAKRSYKIGKSSKEIENELGSEIKRKVNLTNPDKEIFVDVCKDGTYVYSKKIYGSKGLPFGSSGKVLILLSGGMDSAVATWFMIKRGCYPIFLYINNSSNDNANADGALKNMEMLSKWSKGKKMKLYIVNNNKAILKFSEYKKFTCVLCKRMMYRIAERIGIKENVDGIVTGESIAQVASQTLHNLFVLNSSVSIPIYRPVIGFDKSEIISIAKEIGVYKSSISLSKNCGFVPNKPSTRSNIEKIEDIEKNIQIKKMLDESVNNVITMTK